MRLTIAVVALAATATGVVLAQSARGLDHDTHSRAAAAAEREVSCADCHQIAASGALVGTPTHKWCFGSCHEAPAKHVRRKPYTIAIGSRRLCETCHPRASLDRAASGDATAFAIASAPSGPREFQVALSHEVHAAASCASCHPFSSRPPRPHSRCLSCHSREPVAGTLPMASCSRCHQVTAGPTLASPFSVGEKFSHQRHAPRTRAAGSCEACHPGVAKATTMANIAAPTKTTCVGCHDGQRAFTTRTGCRKCHSTPATLGERVRAPIRVFTHTSHAEAACSSCHDQRGRFTAGAGHDLCSQGACHPSELSSRAPVTCSSCHVGSEPWLPQHIDPPSRPSSDFGTRFEHARHQVKACESCHRGDPGGANAGLSEGHASCAGSKCHDAGATAPSLTECQRCHVASGRASRRASADSRRWSVRKTFDHLRHRTGLDGSLLVCAVCHESAEKPPSGDRDLPPPTKTSCVACHDGKSAFKVTGHECRRCHLR